MQVLSGEQQGLFYFGKARKQNKDREPEKDVGLRRRKTRTVVPLGRSRRA